MTNESTAKESMKGNAVETIEPEVTIEEQAEAAEAFTQGLVDAFDLGAQVRSVIVDEGIVVDVTGESLGLLVGPRGATLNAIEELVRTVVQRQTDGHGVRINVDVAGYRGEAPRGPRGVHAGHRREGARDGSRPGARADVGARSQGRA